jgi:hypothetical protein
MANIVQGSNAEISSRAYSMTDNVFVGLFSVALPTTNTSCSVIIMAEFIVSDGANSGNHVGMFCWSFCNNAGTVTGQGTDFAEAVSGTGAGAGIDTCQVVVVGTTATAQMRFNNTLNVAGSLSYRILFSTALALTRL